jgi:aryl-alcohol dehydrogenase-like predicted oxidoreductase
LEELLMAEIERRSLGRLWPVSALTLGGGGLGQLWGATDREEAVATVRAAVDAGIDLIDLAPLYGKGEAERVVGETFRGGWPDAVRVTTKCLLGSPPAEEVETRLRRSLERSLETIGRDHVDLFFLHSNICPDDYSYRWGGETQDRWATRWSLYTDHVVPAMTRLRDDGLIGAWGITGTGLPISVMEALRHDPAPAAVQAVSNLMDSAGGMRLYEEPPEPRNIIRTARANGIGVMGIRAVQAGALTAALDRPLPAEDPEAKDFAKAVPFRDLAAELGEDPARLAHRYALDMDGVDTVVLGVKNRAELSEALAAAAAGRLPDDLRARIDGLGLARQIPKMPI